MTYDLFDVEQVDDVTVVRLAGTQLDSGPSANELRDELESLIDEQQPRKLVVSFCRVPHITSPAVGALLHVREKAIARGCVMKLCEMHPAICDAFTVLDMDGALFPIHDCESEALNDFRTKPR